MQDQVYIPVPLYYQKSDASQNALELVPELNLVKKKTQNDPKSWITFGIFSL